MNRFLICLLLSFVLFSGFQFLSPHLSFTHSLLSFLFSDDVNITTLDHRYLGILNVKIPEKQQKNRIIQVDIVSLSSPGSWPWQGYSQGFHVYFISSSNWGTRYPESEGGYGIFQIGLLKPGMSGDHLNAKT